MRRIVVLSALILAPVLGAQVQPTPTVTTTIVQDSSGPRHPSWFNSLEIGLYPTARHYTPDTHYNGLWGGGFTGTIGYQFAPILSLEAGYSDTWNPNIVSQDRGNPLTQLGTLSLQLQAPTSFPVVPYVAGGAGYNWFQFHLPSAIYPDLSDIRTKGFWIWQPAAGFKIKLNYAVALRAEANMQVQHNQRATSGGFVGVSFFPGARKPAPKYRQVTMTYPPVHDTVSVHTTDTVTVTQTVVAQRTVVDTSVLFVLSDVNFAFAKATIQPRGHNVLDRAATQLNGPALQNVPIVVEGFTDSIGSDSANYKLGLARATAVRDYLVSKGVAPDRVTTVSGGKANPVASNSTATGRAQNRRVVIRKNQTGGGQQPAQPPSGAGGPAAPPGS
jgi:outer membrane protein OmpA-like peptidoglycan-associated protein